MLALLLAALFTILPFEHGKGHDMRVLVRPAEETVGVELTVFNEDYFRDSAQGVEPGHSVLFYVRDIPTGEFSVTVTEMDARGRQHVSPPQTIFVR